jgi:glycosyltransferase involved in cell wall biosynthesis
LSQVARSFYHQWLRVSGQMIDRFVAMAPSMIDEIVDLAGVPPHRIAIINDPVLNAHDIARSASLARTKATSGRHFLAIGRLAPQKNFSLLLDAFARIARPDDRLTILGEGAQRAALIRRAVALGIAGQLRMPGHVHDVIPWLADADVFVMSSNYEGVPAVLIEAIAARLPVVATNCSASIADLTGYGRFGTLVPVGNVAAFAKAMDSAPAGAPLSIDALNHARAFTVEAGANAYLAVMREMLGNEAYRPDHRVHADAALVG